MGTQARRTTIRFAHVFYATIFRVFRILKMTGLRCGEYEPTQRNRYFADFQQALKYDAIEAGILPVVLALYEAGAQPEFSCEGHMRGRYTYSPYVCVWVRLDLFDTLVQSVTRALAGPLHYEWHLEVKDSATSKLACPGAGEKGAFLTLRWHGRPHRLRPSSGRDPRYLDKEFAAADVQQIAQRLRSRAGGC